MKHQNLLKNHSTVLFNPLISFGSPVLSISKYNFTGTRLCVTNFAISPYVFICLLNFHAYSEFIYGNIMLDEP